MKKRWKKKGLVGVKNVYGYMVYKTLYKVQATRRTWCKVDDGG